MFVAAPIVPAEILRLKFSAQILQFFVSRFFNRNQACLRNVLNSVKWTKQETTNKKNQTNKYTISQDRLA